MLFLKPIFAFLRCATELAILRLLDQPVILSFVLSAVVQGLGIVLGGAGTSGGRVQTEKH